MTAKELKKILQDIISEMLKPILNENEFAFQKSSCSFVRNIGDFKQSVKFYFTPIRYSDDQSIGHLSIRIWLESDAIEETASTLVNAVSKLDKVDVVVNVDYGLITGNEAVIFYPNSISDLKEIFRTRIVPCMLNEIIPWLNTKTQMVALVNDYFDKKEYMNWSSSNAVALRIIAICFLLNDIITAKKIAYAEFTKPNTGVKYKNILHKLEKI
ncbi:MULTISPECIES: hypothetical protein [Bacteroidales]|jgi:hypothetical protein|uniref:DUF4304 domain-containing protein n=3 Tax=Bacteroidales TaxID=171549 RepID=A0A6A1JW09_9BACE|nr:MULTISPECIES: hypothetical protein [Bacteroidales]KAB3831353.1 hypothetical protein GAS47_24225 [Phocaeicola vulgatus]KAA5478378.1 hypothetical protein F2Y27_13585 [Bacteroides caccae]KAA5489364.1 hypothetical protein F2Y25_11910 [Bacteroides caccae]KAA5490883.1 hypothetical protein F2Y35_12595 [Bacteroides caccae]KAA5504799.1 hypothetical protein F2Y47_08340 [Bacteroides caccae]